MDFSIPNLYRKRLIPNECIHLKDDEIVYRSDDIIITKWKSLKPKKILSHGTSCYFLNKGYKVSQFFDHENKLMYWYCDIIQTTYEKSADTYTMLDLLVDVIIYPDGFVKVVDLDEVAQSMEKGLITDEQVKLTLNQLNDLLTLIYNGGFDEIKDIFKKYFL